MINSCVCFNPCFLSVHTQSFDYPPLTGGFDPFSIKETCCFFLPDTVGFSGVLTLIRLSHSSLGKALVLHCWEKARNRKRALETVKDLKSGSKVNFMTHLPMPSELWIFIELFLSDFLLKIYTFLSL